MLLTVNIGNSTIAFGFFKDDICELEATLQISTDMKKTADEYLATITALSGAKGIALKNITDAVISSVVPQLTEKIKITVNELTGCTPLIVGPGIKTGFKIKIDDPTELGADIVADAVAVCANAHSKNAVIANIDTVTTVSAINGNCEYLGCAIFSGVQMSLDALRGETAQLPNTSPSVPKRAIGRNSAEAISSGVILGNAMAIDGFVESFCKEMNCQVADTELIATGEYAQAVLLKSKHSFRIDPQLTLKGLYRIYKNTVKDK